MSSLNWEDKVADWQYSPDPSGLFNPTDNAMVLAATGISSATSTQAETIAEYAPDDNKVADQPALGDIANNIGPQGSSPGAPASVELPLQLAGTEYGSDNSDDSDDSDMQPDVESRQLVKLVSYHHNADLCVKVRGPEGIAIYKVVSALVAAASPAWRTRISGYDLDVILFGDEALDLTDSMDHAYGLDTVFSIIHYKFHEIPYCPAIGQLHGIVKVAEAYDCMHLLLPYMTLWLNSFNWQITGSQDSDDDEKAVYISWILGDGRGFASIVTNVAHKATLSEDGMLLDTRGRSWNDSGLPPAIVDLMAETRSERVTKITKSINGLLQNLMAGANTGYFQFCRANGAHEQTRESCQLQQIGSLVSGLTAVGMLPVPDPGQYLGSVADMIGKVCTIKVSHFRDPGAAPYWNDHQTCGLQLVEALSSVVCSDAKLGAEIIQQLASRACRYGIFNVEHFKHLERASGLPEGSSAPAGMDGLLLGNNMHVKQVTEVLIDMSPEDVAKQPIDPEDLAL